MCMCPTSNFSVGFIKDGDHFREIIQTLWKAGVKFCMNTDNPSMLRTNLKKEIEYLRTYNCLTEEQIDQTIQWAFDCTFIPTEKGRNLYL